MKKSPSMKVTNLTTEMQNTLIERIAKLHNTIYRKNCFDDKERAMLADILGDMWAAVRYRDSDVAMLSTRDR